MNIRELAEKDLSYILEDVNGFSHEVTLTDLSNVSYNVRCWGADIGLLVDPATGANFIGRNIEIYCRRSSLDLLNAPEIKEKWKVSMTNVNNDNHKLIVKFANHDRTLGIVRLVLETKTNVS